MYLLHLFPIWFCQQKIYSVTSGSDGLKIWLQSAGLQGVTGWLRGRALSAGVAREGTCLRPASPSLGSGASPVLSLKNTSERGRGCDL